jgi:hypothetical protein
VIHFFPAKPVFIPNSGFKSLPGRIKFFLAFFYLIT